MENLIKLLEIPYDNNEILRLYSLSQILRLSKLDNFDKAESFVSCIVLVKDKIYDIAKYIGLTPIDNS